MKNQQDKKRPDVKTAKPSTPQSPSKSDTGNKTMNPDKNSKSMPGKQDRDR